MRFLKGATSGAVAIAMLSATGAMAAPTRSATAMPTNQSAPVTSTRTATQLQGASSQSDGTPVLGYVLAGIMGAGIIAATITATNDDSHYRPVSGG